MSETEFHI